MNRPMPRCMMPDGGECCPEYHALLNECNAHKSNAMSAEYREAELRKVLDEQSSEVRETFEWAWFDARGGTDESHQWLHENVDEAWDTYQSIREVKAISTSTGGDS